MLNRRWTSFDHIFFDCDSTLSAIEGVDELARLKGKEWRVSVPTQTSASYLAYEKGPLTISAGKPEIVRELVGERWGRKLFVGDGMSDLRTHHVVDLFVGFGGVARRAKVESGSDVYVVASSLAP